MLVKASVRTTAVLVARVWTSVMMCTTTTAITAVLVIVLAVTDKVIEVKVIEAVSLRLSTSTSAAVIVAVRLKYRRNCM